MRQFFMFPIFYFDRDRTNSNYMSTPFSMNSLALVKYKDCILRSLRANVTWVMLLSIKCCSLKIANIAWRLFGIEPMHNHNISCENSRKVRHGNISTATLQPGFVITPNEKTTKQNQKPKPIKKDDVNLYRKKNRQQLRFSSVFRITDILPYLHLHPYSSYDMSHWCLY